MPSISRTRPVATPVADASHSATSPSANAAHAAAPAPTPNPTSGASGVLSPGAAALLARHERAAVSGGGGVTSSGALPNFGHPPLAEEPGLSAKEAEQRFVQLLKRDAGESKHRLRTENQIQRLQPSTQEKVRAFYAEAQAYLDQHFPGWMIAGNGSERAYSNEVARRKPAGAPFMHFSRLAMDFQPVIDGKMVSYSELKAERFDKYNDAIAKIARDVGLTPGREFNHPEHFEDRQGQLYSRDLQHQAEAGDFGITPRRDKTQSRLEGKE